MRVGVHGRRMIAASAPVAAGVLRQMKALGMAPVLHHGLAAWLTEEGPAAGDAGNSILQRRS
jgi:hypothetical protein